MLDLLECALEDCERRQHHERRQLAARAPEFANIRSTLEALSAAGLLVAPGGVQILPHGFEDGRSDEILITSRAAAIARGIGAHRLADARMTRIAGTDTTPTEVWSHPDGWALMVEWIDTVAHVCTPVLSVAAREGNKATLIVILSAAHGIGKSLHARALAKAFGCHMIVDEYDGTQQLHPGSLALTNMHPDHMRPVRGYGQPQVKVIRVETTDELEQLLRGAA